MLTVNDFKEGEVIVIEKRHPNCSNTKHETTIIAIDYKGNGLVTYSGIETGSGAFDPTTLDNPSRFQTVIGVEKTGKTQRSYSSWQPQPGNRGYDLMC